MAAIQTLKKAIKDKTELRDRYASDLAKQQASASDKQIELDRVSAEIVDLEEALKILEGAPEC